MRNLLITVLGSLALTACEGKSETEFRKGKPARTAGQEVPQRPEGPTPAGAPGLPAILPPAPLLPTLLPPPPECPRDAAGHDGTLVCSSWVFDSCGTGTPVRYRRVRNCDPAYQCRTSDDNPDGTVPDAVAGGPVVNCSNPPSRQTPAPAPAMTCPTQSLTLPTGCLYRGGGEVVNGCPSLGQVLCRSPIRTAGNQVLTVGPQMIPFSAGSTIQVDAGKDIPLVVNAPIEVTFYAAAGGGGGAGSVASTSTASPGGGGGGGAVNETGYTLLLVPGTVYFLDVGAAGLAGDVGKAGTSGGETSLRSDDGTVYFYLEGGKAGQVGGNGGDYGYVGVAFGENGGRGGATSIAGVRTSNGQGVGVPGGGGGGGAGNYNGRGRTGGAGGNSGSAGDLGTGALGMNGEGGNGGEGAGLALPGIAGLWGAGGGGAGGSVKINRAGKGGQPGVMAIKFMSAQ